MRGQGLSAVNGCLVLAMLPLLALGGWRFLRGQGWGYSQFGWSIAADDCRVSMARDYVATRDVYGMSLDQLRAELGQESRLRDNWTYFVGDYVPTTYAFRTYYRSRPELELHFDRGGKLEALAPRDLWDGPIDSFDEARWRATPSKDRAPMARDLIERELFLGASRGELRQLLGDPDGADIRVQYFVGEGSSDNLYLEVQLNLDMRIVDACVSEGF